MSSLYYRNADGEILDIKALRSVHRGRYGGNPAVVGIPVSGVCEDVVIIEKFSPLFPERPYIFLNWVWALLSTRERQGTCSYEEFEEYASGKKLRLVTCDVCGCSVPITKTYRDCEGNFLCPYCKADKDKGSETR